MALLVLGLLNGCDQGVQPLSDLITPPTAADMDARVRDLARRGKTQDALRQGEAWLAAHLDLQGDLHRTLAQLLVDSGDAAGAVRHLARAAGSSANTASVSPSPASAPDSASAPASVPAQAAQLPTAPSLSVSAEGASARITPHSIEVRAGDAQVTVPK
jgi:hypothetical protein